MSRCERDFTQAELWSVSQNAAPQLYIATVSSGTIAVGQFFFSRPGQANNVQLTHLVPVFVS